MKTVRLTESELIHVIKEISSEQSVMNTKKLLASSMDFIQAEWENTDKIKRKKIIRAVKKCLKGKGISLGVLFVTLVGSTVGLYLMLTKGKFDAIVLISILVELGILKVGQSVIKNIIDCVNGTLDKEKTSINTEVPNDELDDKIEASVDNFFQQVRKKMEGERPEKTEPEIEDVQENSKVKRSKVIRMTENDLRKVVSRVINEQNEEQSFIAAIQKFLNEKLKTNLKPDGFSGTDTQKAIMKYQSLIKCYPTDGVWGPDTWEKMPFQDKKRLKDLIAEEGGLIDRFLNFFGF